MLLDTMMRVLMNMVPFDLLSLLWIESSLLFQGMFRGYELLMGGCKAEMYFNSPREAIETFGQEQEHVSLEKSLCPVDTRFKGDQAYFDFCLSSCIEFTLKAGNNLVLNPMMQSISNMP